VTGLVCLGAVRLKAASLDLGVSSFVKWFCPIDYVESESVPQTRTPAPVFIKYESYKPLRVAVVKTCLRASFFNSHVYVWKHSIEGFSLLNGRSLFNFADEFINIRLWVRRGVAGAEFSAYDLSRRFSIISQLVSETEGCSTRLPV